MKHFFIEKILRRAENAKEESDFTYFFNLLLAGEALTKLITLGILAALVDDKDRHRYRLEHSLVRADGLGDWSKVVDDVLAGPASQHLIEEVRREQTELTASCQKGDWQYEAVSTLKEALNHLKIEGEAIPTRSDMKRWFRLFATLRNKTRAHGATQSADSRQAAVHLSKSIQLFCDNFSLFQRPWVYLYRNLSGKYRISPIANRTPELDFLKRETTHNFSNGVYIYFGVPKHIPLILSDPELNDFFIANGGFNGKRYELISYITDDRHEGDASIYLIPPGNLPPSETHGYGELMAKGNCFSNVPPPSVDYVARQQLQQDLFELLIDDRRAMITLLGTGGVGKTFLTLKVIDQLYTESRYVSIVWFSARDIDLLEMGPKPVRPAILSPDDISNYYAKFVLAEDQLKQKKFSAKTFFEQQLSRCDLGPCLFVFDNFETVQNPVEMFNWIDTYIRVPNKILITTRLREFKGDYPLEVQGMTVEEAKALIDQTARQLQIRDMLTPEYIDQLISSADGHPYVIKILLGEVANKQALGAVPQIVAGRDEILGALFERTYAALSPCAQRAFMTLAAWSSAVPRIVLEAVLLNSTKERCEVEKGIDSLLHYSLAERHSAPADQQEFISLPLVASIFGKRKLQVSFSKAAIQNDVEILQMLGPSKSDDVHLGLAKRLERFIANVAQRVDNGDSLTTYNPILEMICRTYNPGWILLSRWHMERSTPSDLDAAKAMLRRFLEKEPMGSDSGDAWQMLANVCNRAGDVLGEVQALIERSQLDLVPFNDVSNAANLLNRRLYENTLDVERDERHQLAQQLLRVLDRRKSEASADDFSRMAWLALHIKQEQVAIEYAKNGLKMDSENSYCRRIAERLGIN